MQMSQYNKDRGVFLGSNSQTTSNKQLSQKAVNTIADAILKAVEMRISKLQKRIERLEKAAGIHDGR